MDMGEVSIKLDNKLDQNAFVYIYERYSNNLPIGTYPYEIVFSILGACHLSLFLDKIGKIQSWNLQIDKISNLGFK